MICLQANVEIDHLNDYCLFDIFTIKSIDLLDLCSIGETCTRFREISQRIAPREFHFNIRKDSTYNLESGKNENQTYGPTDIKRIFKNFGPILRAVSITFSKYYERFPGCRREFNDLINLVIEHCSSDNLLSLKIEYQRISRYYLVEMMPIFERLQILNLKDVRMIGASTAQFAGLLSLVELYVYNVNDCGAILQNIFPKLERFT